MNREIIWQREDGPGQEHLTISDRNGVIVADGFAISKPGEEPIRVRYQVVCDAAWATRGVAITTEVGHGSPTVVELRSDGKGHWTNSDGSPLPQLDGCIDVDLTTTPFTNTLPIRRLGLERGQREKIHVAWIDVESLRIVPQEQIYTAVAPGIVQFESPSSGFRQELEIDGDGLVRNYPGLFRRIWTK